MKRFSLFFLLTCHAFAVENLTVAKSTFQRRTSIFAIPVPSLYMQAQDSNNAATQFTIRWVADTAVWQAHGFANSIETIANCTGSSCSAGGGKNHGLLDLSVGTGIGSIGGVNLRDGAAHTVYPWAVSGLGDDATNDQLMQWAPFRLKWDAANSNYFPEIISTGTGGTIPFNKHLILINSNDVCSTGAVTASPCGTAPAGNLVCVDPNTGISIYDNAAPGYWISKHSANNCTNVWAVSIPRLDTIARTTLNTAISAAMAFAATNSLQAIYRGWLFPGIVLEAGGTPNQCGTGNQCEGIDGYLSVYAITGGASPPCFQQINKATKCGQWTSINPYLNQVGNLTPYTSFAFRPSTGGVLAHCIDCTTSTNINKNWLEDFATSKLVIDDATAAIGTNPTGVAQFAITTASGGTSHFVPEIAPSSIGTSLNSRVTVSLCGTYPSPLTVPGETLCAATNNILYANDTTNYTLPTISFAQGSGLASVSGSVNGQVLLSPTTGNSQTPILAGMSVDTGGLHGGLQAVGAHPAVYGMSSCVEPGGYVSGKQMQNHEAVIQRLGLGDSVEVATWGSLIDPLAICAYGDPLAQPFIPPFGAGANTKSGTHLMGGKINAQ